MQKKKLKVLACLSGGVDSSVATALLVRQGYDVTVAYMVNYDDPIQQKSCWRGDYQDALRVSAKLGIKLLRLDFQKEYKRDVLKYMYQEYSSGRTPNPDVLCNKFIKFGAWLDKAKKLGFDYIATGHYAQVEKNKNKFVLLESEDKDKDQTYFLHQLNQEQLRHVLFPIGGYTKTQVRALAKKFALPTAQKEESMGICFVGEVPMKDFLKNKVKAKPGKILNTKGEILGEHEGLAFYTIGERGLGLNNTKGKSVFVVGKNIKNNELIVGESDDSLLYKKEIEVADVNWISGQSPKFPLKCQVRLRHRQELQSATICHSRTRFASINSGGNPVAVLIKFAKPQRAITPGQFAVFYSARHSPKGAKEGDKGKCLGGGMIK